MMTITPTKYIKGLSIGNDLNEIQTYFQALHLDHTTTPLVNRE